MGLSLEHRHVERLRDEVTRDLESRDSESSERRSPIGDMTVLLPCFGMIPHSTSQSGRFRANRGRWKRSREQFWKPSRCDGHDHAEEMTIVRDAVYFWDHTRISAPSLNVYVKHCRS